MKKAIFTVIVLTIVSPIVFAQVEKMEEATRLVFRGDQYLLRFKMLKDGKSDQYYNNEDYKSDPYSLSSDVPIVPYVLLRSIFNSGESDYKYSNVLKITDIDEAIDCYNKALKLFPSGTWNVPKKYKGYSTAVTSDFSLPLLAYIDPPQGGVKARLENANKIKQEWLAGGETAWKKAQREKEEEKKRADEEKRKAVMAASFSVTLNKAGNGAVITGYSGEESDIYIPATIEGFPVTEIGDNFKWPKNYHGNCIIKSVVIPQGVTRIGDKAFKDASYLTAVTIPSTVTSIGAEAFSGCGSLDAATQVALRKLGYKGSF